MKLVLKNVRLSFPALFTAEQYQGTGPFNYRASFLVPEGSKTAKEITAAVSAVANEKLPAKGDAIVEKARAGKTGVCWNDGNDREYDGYQGHWVLVATKPQEKGRPDIRDRDGKTPLVAEDGKPYAGSYCNAIVDIWPQDNDFGKTVRCTLVGIQFAKDGEAFSGGAVVAEGDFEDLGDEADNDMV